MYSFAVSRVYALAAAPRLKPAAKSVSSKNASAQLVYVPLNQLLAGGHFDFGEEGADCMTAGFVCGMICGKM